MKIIQLALIEPWFLKDNVYIYNGVEYHYTEYLGSYEPSSNFQYYKVSAPGFVASWLPPAQPLFLS